jgi:hypothetical protein
LQLLWILWEALTTWASAIAHRRDEATGRRCQATSLRCHPCPVVRRLPAGTGGALPSRGRRKAATCSSTAWGAQQARVAFAIGRHRSSAAKILQRGSQRSKRSAGFGLGFSCAQPSLLERREQFFPVNRAFWLRNDDAQVALRSCGGLLGPLLHHGAQDCATEQVSCVIELHSLGIARGLNARESLRCRRGRREQVFAQLI